MKKIIISAVLTLVGAASIFAQTADYHKTEVFAGYSNNQVDIGIDPFINGNSRGPQNFDRRVAFNGFNAAAAYNVSRFVGIKADVSGAYRNKRFELATNSTTFGFDTKSSLYNFLGGVQIKDNSMEAKVKPFAHALAGAAYGRTRIINVNCSSGGFCANLSSASDSKTGFAGAIGGGVDVKISNKIDIRAISVDYNPVRLDGATSHNVRIGVGIVIK